MRVRVRVSVRVSVGVSMKVRVHVQPESRVEYLANGTAEIFTVVGGEGLSTTTC